MKSKFKWLLMALLTVGMILYIVPNISLAETTGEIYYIKNNYTPGAYLYEAEGILRYGIPVENDASFQWIIEDNGSFKTIKNAATKHYITLEGHGDATVEGNWGEVVQCLTWADNKDTFLWDFAITEEQNLLSASTSYAGFALHLENVTNGQVSGQKISGDQLNWGNMKWDFVSEDKVNFTTLLRNGFCIQNTEDGTYLRVDKGILTHGIPDGPDNAYIWEIEQQADGSKAIKNKLTSQYISMSNYDETTFSLSLEDYAIADNKLFWNFQISKAVTILSMSKDYKGYGLYLELASNDKVKCNDILSESKKLTDGMKWNFYPSGDIAEVAGSLILDSGVYNLKNSYYSLYLIEDNGVAVYGNAKTTDINAQWEIIYDAEVGKTAIKNKGTGDYLYVMGDSQKLICDNKENYYWNMKRHTNELYPNAVLFQDSIYSDSYLHMESLNGFLEDSNAVQPTWGTPHWDPIKCEVTGSDVSASEVAKEIVPVDYIRLQSSAEANKYLYENTSGALTYKECGAADARSHWKLIESGTSGAYKIQNRETGDYITNKGNGTLRCLAEDQAIAEGSLWEVSEGNATNKLLLNNAYAEMKSYLRPYLNIQKHSGFAQSNLVSTEEETTQWIYEVAQEKTTSTSDAELVSVPLNVFPDTNIYQIVYNGKQLDNLYKLEYYGSKVRIIDIKTNQYLYYEDGWKLKSLKVLEDITVQWSINTKAGVTILTNGEIKLQPVAIASDSIYTAERVYLSGDKSIYAVSVDQAGTYQVGIESSDKKASIEVGVNGTIQGILALPSKEGISLSLNKGINTISLTGSTEVSKLTIYKSRNKNYRGASVLYTEYQAEDCNTNGTILDEDRTYHAISSEAAGRLAVNLEGTGQYIKVTLAKPANSLIIRYCIPDSSEGIGQDQTLNLYIDGKKNKSIELTSRYSWVYGGYPWTNNPADGQAHHFFDETSVLLDQTYPVGTVIKLQKDAANHGEYYIIDKVDLEELPTAAPKPQNGLSILDFGAIADDGRDDSKAFYECMTSAVNQGKEVWIPVGRFDISTPTSDYDAGDQQDKNRGIVISEDNIVIRGAGMWYSILQGDYAAFFVKASNIAFYDFSLRGTAVARRDSIDPSAIETDYNTPVMKNMTVQNVWIEHYKTGIWTHNMNGLHIVGCRIRDTFADGMNLRKGTSNAVVEQCDVRNTGDDAIALWSSEASDTKVSIRFNTVGLQWLANNIAVYGGTDIEITDNLLRDTVVNGAGINISTNFDPKPFMGNITVARNTLERCGSQDGNNNQNDGAIWFNTVQGNDNHAQIIVKDNVILDSTYQGISFSNRGTIDNVVLEGNVIDVCGSYGIDIIKGAKGGIKGKNNLIQNMMLGDINNNALNSFVITTEVTEGVKHNSKNPNNKPFIIIGVFVFVGIIPFMLRMIAKKERLK